MNDTTNAYPVDSAGITRGAGIPARPLDAFTTAEIIAEIARRPGGTVALRQAIAAADPATLTSEDHSALLDLLGRAFDAAGVE